MDDNGELLAVLYPNDFSDGILIKYNLVGKLGTMFEWNQMYNKAIESSDLNHLVLSI